jgi:NDP-sugar pyrophosphorylase family protein
VPSPTETSAVILVAGLGTRLRPVTDTAPKCLTHIAGKEILGRILDAICQTGIREVILVVGYKHAMIDAFIAPWKERLNITTVLNNNFASSGTATSLKIGLDQCSPGNAALIIEGDVVFAPSLLHSLLAVGSNATMLAKYRPTLHGTFAQLDGAGCLLDWSHQQDRAPNYPVHHAFKTINLSLFNRELCLLLSTQIYAEVIGQTGPNASMERCMQHAIANYGIKIKGIVENTARWFEVDDAHDLEIAESLFSQVNQDV